MNTLDGINLFTFLKIEEEIKIAKKSYQNNNLIKQVSEEAEKYIEKIINNQGISILKINKEIPSAEIFIKSLKTKNPIILKVLEKIYNDLKKYFYEINKNPNIQYKTFEIFIKEQLKPFYLNSNKKSNNKVINMNGKIENYSCIGTLAYGHTGYDFAGYGIML